MFKSLGRRVVGLSVVLSAVAGLALVATPAMAQPGGGGPGGGGGGRGGGGGMGGGRMGDMMAPAIERRNLDKYSVMLGLSDDQKESAQALLEGYEQQTRQIRESIRTKMESIRDKARETGDNSGWQEMRTIGEKAREDRQKADTALLSDLKGILTPAQEEKWPTVERAQRRDQSLRRGFISGERVNLFDLVEKVELTAEQRQPIDVTLGDYDVELDRAIIARNAAYEEAFGQFGRMFGQGGGQGAPDMEKAQETMNKGREAAVRVREVNRKFARQVQDQLPEDKRDGFQNAFLRESFPEVYRPTQAQRALDGAMGMADLTTEQKESLTSIKESFSRSLSAANDKMRAAIEKQESEATIQNMMQRFGPGGRRDDPMADLRKERRELGDAAVESLKKVLTPEQVERLPKADDQGGPDGGGRGGMGGGQGGGQGGDAPAPRRRNRPAQDPT